TPSFQAVGQGVMPGTVCTVDAISCAPTACFQALRACYFVVPAPSTAGRNQSKAAARRIISQPMADQRVRLAAFQFLKEQRLHQHRYRDRPLTFESAHVGGASPTPNSVTTIEHRRIASVTSRHLCVQIRRQRAREPLWRFNERACPLCLGEENAVL